MLPRVDSKSPCTQRTPRIRRRFNEIKFRKDPRNRLGLVLGTGMEIVTSSYHSYNHGQVLTGRIVF
jgi:hypothetical protein